MKSKAQAVFDTAKMKIDESGVENFFWPLTRREQEIFRDSLIEGLVSISRFRNDENDEDRDLISAFSQLILREGMALFFVHTVNQRCIKAGKEPVWPPSNPYCRSIPLGHAPQVTDSILIKSLSKGPSCHPKWKRFFVKLKHDFGFNGWCLKILSPARSEVDIYACHTTDVLEEHARCVKDNVRYTLLGEWFSPITDADIETSMPLPVGDKILNEALVVLTYSFKQAGEDLPDFLANYFANILVDGSRLVRLHLDRVKAKSAKIPKRLWTGTGAYLWVRLLRHAVRNAGGDVTGHEHGTGESIISYFNTKTFSDLESANRFVTFNTNQKKWLESTIDKRFLVPHQQPAIEVPEYPEGFVRYAGRPLRGQRRVISQNREKLKVMYVAPIYCGFNPRISHHNMDIVIVDWQSRLLSKLQEWGFEILLKPHPEGEQRPPISFAEKFGAKVIPGAFEDVWNLADVYIFDWKTTTAFSTAISTGLPLVMVDFEFEKFAPDMQKLVEKNCSLVKGWTDASNRLDVDWQALRAAIANPLLGENNELREKAFKFE